MTTLIRDIPDELQQKRGWKVEVNGEEVKDVSRVRISSKYGELNYGQTPSGWDGWSFHELGGGGSVIVPFVFWDCKLYVGVVLQMRHNQGGEVYNVPRDFLDPDETHFEAATRELLEETGYTPLENGLRLLRGKPANPNSAFFETAGEDEGVKFYALRVLPNCVEMKEKGQLVFNPKVVKPVSKVAEGISKCVFISYTEAVLAGDMFTLAGIARLIGGLETDL